MAETRSRRHKVAARRLLVSLQEPLFRRIEKRVFVKKQQTKRSWSRNSEIVLLLERGLEAEGEAVPA